MKLMSLTIEENEERHGSVVRDRDEALEKESMLRGIIRDLEAQVQAKTQEETELKVLNEKLKEVVQGQRETNDELAARLEDAEAVDPEIQQKYATLLDEVQKLRITNEFAGSDGAVKQMNRDVSDHQNIY